MADESQVETAIVNFLGEVFYPLGTAFPSAVSTPVNIERGWPTEADVRGAVKNNLVIVRVHAVGGFSKDDTRFPREWIDQAEPGITLVATISGFAITFSGLPAVGQFIGVTANGIGYAYAVQSGDTVVSIAAAFAAAIPASSASGAVLTLQIAGILPAVVVTQSGNSMLEPGRVGQLFVIAVWAPTPALRDQILQLIFPQMVYVYRLTLADGSIATLMDIQTTGPEDVPGRAGEWRRDLRLNYDYPLTIVQVFPPVVIPTVNVTESWP